MSDSPLARQHSVGIKRQLPESSRERLEKFSRLDTILRSTTLSGEEMEIATIAQEQRRLLVPRVHLECDKRDALIVARYYTSIKKSRCLLI